NINFYIRNYHVYLYSKAKSQNVHGLLRLLEVTEQLWKYLSMDFVVKIQECESYNAVWVVVDHLTKKRH
ncbi:hypothetical protein K440DRAFT_545989, partial [Wilcoxina mikolae CBS 423.85]